ncbi:hypothetical protein [Streptomyces albiflavescens]|nr:hypothetical protein [Streptomyces albiflavescens]
MAGVVACGRRTPRATVRVTVLPPGARPGATIAYAMVTLWAN